MNLGYEPQWLLVKNSQTAGTNWQLCDNMRGWTASNSVSTLNANTSGAEVANNGWVLSGTGFSSVANDASKTYIYIAIRRGPMKTPTTGTSVFLPSVQNTNTNATVTTNFPVDLIIQANNGDNRYFLDRLRGTSTTSSVYLTSNTTNAETSAAAGIGIQSNTSFTDAFNPAANPRYYAYRRAPGFFDEVCYTGNGGSRTVAHNLGVAPELMIIKSRSSSSYQWIVYCSYLTAPTTSILCLNLNIARDTGYTNFFDSTAPSASVITLGVGSSVNNSGDTYVAYLFASCPGVSKVGSYTGTGATQTISCGFTAGARFVLIKRTDSTGDWYVWDSARGIVAGNDPYLLLNSTAAEVTSTDYVDSYSAGFEISSTAPAAINASGGSFIYLAIA